MTVEVKNDNKYVQLKKMNAKMINFAKSSENELNKV
jgi:hypothetical protein